MVKLKINQERERELNINKFIDITGIELNENINKINIDVVNECYDLQNNEYEEYPNIRLGEITINNKNIHKHIFININKSTLYLNINL